MSEDCIFCSMVENEVSTYKVHEDENVLGFLDKRPVAKGHTLVIPKKHVENIHQAKDMDFIWNALVETADAVKKAYNAEGINITQNNGEAAGQEVFHLHFHVTPRYTGEEVELNYNRSQLENGAKIAERIRNSYD